MTQTASNSYQRQLAAHRQLERVSLPQTVPELLESAAKHHGNRLAVNFFEDKRSLTFTDLLEQTNAAANGLARYGVRRGAHVAVVLPNRIEYPVIWLALSRLGAVMVPVNSAYTSRELAFVINDADVEYLIIDESLVHTYREIEDPACRLDDERVLTVGTTSTSAYPSFGGLLTKAETTFSRDVSLHGSDLLNIQYTSGTTGLPKGVMQTHDYWIINGCAPGLLWPEVRSILSDHPFFYMDPQWMLITGLYLGATVHFSRGMSVRRFMGWIHDHAIELAWLPDPLLKEPAGEHDAQTSVKVFLAYAFTREMIEQAESRYEGCVVRELYGMTEIGLGLVVPTVLDDPSILGSCGIPAPFRQCRIVDDDGSAVEQGKTGELWVNGKGTTIGYYKRPDANKQLFVNGWFRTGDLFRQDENGYFSIVGRKKDMVKRSGENISALEVENVLKDLSEIEEAAVVPVPDEHRNEEVKAYIKLRQGIDQSPATAQLIIRKCSESLARFKVPRFLEFVESFPMTPSGKVAKKTLTEAKTDPRSGSYDAIEDRWV